MARKHHRKKKYYSVTDRPVVKILGSVITGVTFLFLYYLIVVLMERPGLALTCAVPCVMVVIWVAIKQRYFWWIWLIGACPCIVLMVIFRQPVASLVIQTLYWILSLAMCQWLIFASSRAAHRSKRKKSSRHHHHSSEPPAPRPKDELLERLFAESK